MKIERTLFWFKDSDGQITSLCDDFFGLGHLLNRLLNEVYDGKKIKFINIDFTTNKAYELHPVIPKDKPYYYGGHLRYYGVFSRDQFERLSRAEQTKYVWDEAYKYLCASADLMKNKKLLEAATYAHKRGIEINMNTDCRQLETVIDISGEQMKASLWINFKEDGMYSKLTIENAETILFEKEIDKTKIGVEYFLDMYKAIAFDGNNIVIKGRKDVDYLPLKIPLPEFVLNK